MIETNTYTDRRVRIRVFGDFTCTTAVSFRHVVNELVGRGVTITIDLRGVERIDAEGVSALVGTVRRLRAVGGKAQVDNAQPEVRTTFEIAGVHDILLGPTTIADCGA
jgi:anti-anti-sigma factor